MARPEGHARNILNELSEVVSNKNHGSFGANINPHATLQLILALLSHNKGLALVFHIILSVFLK